jgi:hypothetical protein
VEHSKKKAIEALRNYLEDVKRTPAEDLSTKEQTISDYTTPENQHQYTHMYLAKHIGTWSILRKLCQRLLGSTSYKPSSLHSIGAGPILDVLGWCWKPHPYINAVACCDLLPWDAVRLHKSFSLAINSLVGEYDFNNGKHFLGPENGTSLLPEQLREAGIQPGQVTPVACPKNSIVLLSMVFNHMREDLGDENSDVSRRWAKWSKECLANDCLLVAVDYKKDFLDNAFRLATKPTAAEEIEPRVEKFRVDVSESIIEVAHALFEDEDTRSYRSYEIVPQGCELQFFVLSKRLDKPILGHTFSSKQDESPVFNIESLRNV